MPARAHADLRGRVLTSHDRIQVNILDCKSIIDSIRNLSEDAKERVLEALKSMMALVTDVAVATELASTLSHMAAISIYAECRTGNDHSTCAKLTRGYLVCLMQITLAQLDISLDNIREIEDSLGIADMKLDKEHIRYLINHLRRTMGQESD